jgi:hypothetical protein
LVEPTFSPRLDRNRELRQRTSDLTEALEACGYSLENTRLLRELRERTGQMEAQSQELAKLNQQLEQRVADQVGEIERMGRLRRFLPPQVADLIVASGSERQLESHRREITALFCDLRGFTGFTESADAEDVMALLRDYHAAIGAIIVKYNGTLERYAGDGVFGIGIAHGFATLGTIGFEGRFRLRRHRYGIQCCLSSVRRGEAWSNSHQPESVDEGRERRAGRASR